MSVLLLLKKLFARLFFPLPLTLLLLAVGIFLLWPRNISPRRKTAGIALMAAAALFLAFGGIFGDVLLRQLTSRYTPLDPAALPERNDYVIAVAGNAFYDAPHLPRAHRFNDKMLLRLSEAASLACGLEQRGLPYQIVVSLNHPTASEEERLAALHAYFGTFGIDPEYVSLIGDAQNTRQEIRAFSAIPGRLLLVSDAFHLPRIMLLAKQCSLDALPAPIGGSEAPTAPEVLQMVPDAGNFASFQTLIYELLGCLEYRIFP